VERHHRPRRRNFRWAIVGVITLLTITNYLDREICRLPRR